MRYNEPATHPTPPRPAPFAEKQHKTSVLHPVSKLQMFFFSVNFTELLLTACAFLFLLPNCVKPAFFPGRDAEEHVFPVQPYLSAMFAL